MGTASLPAVPIITPPTSSSALQPLMNDKSSQEQQDIVAGSHHQHNSLNQLFYTTTPRALVSQRAGLPTTPPELSVASLSTSLSDLHQQQEEEVEDPLQPTQHHHHHMAAIAGITETNAVLPGAIGGNRMPQLYTQQHQHHQTFSPMSALHIDADDLTTPLSVHHQHHHHHSSSSNHHQQQQQAQNHHQQQQQDLAVFFSGLQQNAQHSLSAAGLPTHQSIVATSAAQQFHLQQQQPLSLQRLMMSNPTADGTSPVSALSFSSLFQPGSVSATAVFNPPSASQALLHPSQTSAAPSSLLLHQQQQLLPPHHRFPSPQQQQQTHTSAALLSAAAAAAAAASRSHHSDIFAPLALGGSAASATATIGLGHPNNADHLFLHPHHHNLHHHHHATAGAAATGLPQDFSAAAAAAEIQGLQNFPSIVPGLQLMPGVPAPPGLHCLYKKGRCCRNPRSMKRNGQLHSLCVYHRSKQVEYQRNFDKRNRVKKMEAQRIAEEERKATATAAQSKTSPAKTTNATAAAAAAVLPEEENGLKNDFSSAQQHQLSHFNNNAPAPPKSSPTSLLSSSPTSSLDSLHLSGYPYPPQQQQPALHARPSTLSDDRSIKRLKSLEPTSAPATAAGTTNPTSAASINRPTPYFEESLCLLLNNNDEQQQQQSLGSSSGGDSGAARD